MPQYWKSRLTGSGGADLDGLGEAMKTMEKCHKIAARIMRGDKVPPEDEQYLMKNDPTRQFLLVCGRFGPAAHRASDGLSSSAPFLWTAQAQYYQKKGEEDGEEF